MKSLQRLSALAWLGCLLIVAPAWAREVIPGDTVVKVRLLQDLSSKEAQVGDRVRVAVDEDDQSGLPPGTVLVGRVTQVQEASRSRPGVIDVRFGALELPNRWISISGTPYSLHEKDVRKTANGRLVAEGRRHDPMKFIGYGALGGVLLGHILGTSTLEGVLIGAAAGYLYGETQRDKSKYRDVSLEAGDTFGVRLDRRVVLQPRDYALAPAATGP